MIVDKYQIQTHPIQHKHVLKCNSILITYIKCRLKSVSTQVYNKIIIKECHIIVDEFQVYT